MPSALRGGERAVPDVLRHDFPPDGRVSDPDVRFEPIIGAAHRAYSNIRLAPSIGAQPTPHRVADVCTRAYRMLREGRGASAFQMLQGFRHTEEAIKDADIKWSGSYRTLLTARFGSTLLTLSWLASLRWSRPESVSGFGSEATPIALAGSALCSAFCAQRVGSHEADSDVAAAIASEWTLVFMERGIHENARTLFAAHIPRGAGEGEWKWQRGKLREPAARRPKAAPGPDGMPYHF